VKFEKLDSTGVWVSGVDFLSGTPILDIKPYLPQIESKSEATSGAFSELPDEPRLKVGWSKEAHQQLVSTKNFDVREYIQLVDKTLSLDPRPLIYRELEAKGLKRAYATRIAHFDVHFIFHPELSQIEVLKLEPLS
jgi:hypothetical protein